MWWFFLLAAPENSQQQDTHQWEGPLKLKGVPVCAVSSSLLASID